MTTENTSKTETTEQAQTAQAPATQEAQQPIAPRKKTLRDWMSDDSLKQQVAKALPKHLSADRFLRVALTTITRVPKLAQCDQASFFQALLTCSQLGIEPDGRRAHLIPFDNRKAGIVECQLIIDYKGIVELVLRDGNVARIHCDIVCDNDIFDYDLGEVRQHKLDLRKPRGEAYAAYAICQYKDGTSASSVMSKYEIEEIRKRSRSANSGPWVTDWAEMAKKTVFRRLSKWLNLSAVVREIMEADDEPLDRSLVNVTPAAPAFTLQHNVEADSSDIDEDAKRAGL